ncbi:MAG: hypothetical protein AAF196_19265 [Planctomycetota bacterium]
MVVGVSDENESLLTNYITEKGVKYGIQRANGALSLYGGRGYPTFVMIAPDGTVAQYNGVPSEELIEEKLAEVTLAPEMPEGSAFKKLRQAWEREDYAKVQKELSKGLEKHGPGEEFHQVFTGLQESFDRLIESTTNQVRSLAEGPDYYRSFKRLTVIAEKFEDLEVGDLAEEELDRFDDDDGIQIEIKAGQAVDAVAQRYDISKNSDRKKLIKACEQLMEKFEGTQAAERARVLRRAAKQRER